MQIIDLTKEYEQDFFICLEDWADYMKEAGTKRQEWHEFYKNKGLRVKLVINDDNVLAGFIQYMPVEYSIIEGKDIYFIHCIWIHGHTLGRGNLQGQGMGPELLKAAEEDVRQIGVKGIAAWGLSMPYWMNAAWFEKYGFQKCDEDGMSILVWKPFSEDAIAPKWMRQKKAPEIHPDKITISLFNYGWCPSQNVNYERTLQIAKEFGDKVIIQEYDTKDRTVMEEWGLSDALFVDDEMIANGPPLSSQSIRELIEKHLKIKS
jgi:N-acetylglutamate synthase-like GNAT family acetyltransferase